MTEITLYKPKTINAMVPFPSEWDELYPAEVELVAALLQSTIQEDAKMRTILINGFLKVRGQRHKIKVPKNIIDLVDPEDVVLNLFPLLDWIFSHNRLTKQPYPSFPLPGLRSTSVYGPEDDFNNLTVGEFEDAEHFYFEFEETKSLESLAHLAAILYRPKNTPYIKLTDNQPTVYNHEKRMANFLRIPREKLLAIWLWFTGCRNMMTLYFPDVFSPTPDPSPKGRGIASAPDRLAFTKCIHAAAGPKNGTRQQVRMLPIKELFFDMNEDARAVKEMKRAAKGNAAP